MQTRISGGFSESEEKALTVMPILSPSCSVVTTVTPLAKQLIAFLKPASSIATMRSSMARRLWQRIRAAQGVAAAPFPNGTRFEPHSDADERDQGRSDRLESQLPAHRRSRDRRGLERG